MSADVRAGYKQTEVGVIPEDWTVRSISQVSRKIMDYRGRTPRKLGLNWGDGDIPALSAGNVRLGYIDFEQECYLASEELHRRWMVHGDVEKNDIVFTTEAPLGNVALIPDNRKYVLSQRTVLFQCGEETTHSPFLYQVLMSDSFQQILRDHSSGSTAQGIKRKVLETLLIVSPPLPEQRAIATALSDVDALLSGLDSLIAKKQNLKQAAMQQLLTGQTRLPGFSGEWEVKAMKSLGQTYGGLASKTKEDFGHGSSKYIPFMNVMKDTVIDPDWLESVDVASSEAQNLVKKGDLFFNGSSETPKEVGFCSVLLAEIPNLYLNSFSFGFRFNSDAKVSGLFFAYWFRGADGRTVMSVLAQGATRHNIGKSAFMRLSIPQPTQEEQTAIATVLSDMDTELAALQARRDKTRALKQAMMQELLTGRIRLI